MPWQMTQLELLEENDGSGQRTTKLMSGSPRLVDFAVGLVDFILHLPDGEVKVLGEFFLRKLIIHRSCENFFRPVKITSGLGDPGYSFPEGQAGKLNFVVP